MPRPLPLLVPLLLSACGLFDGGAIDETCEDLPGGCGDDGGGTDDTAAPLTLALDAVEPTWGDVAGGEVLVLRGGPFAADAAVQVGEASATVQSWSDTELQVQAPPASSPGWVDVQVQTGQGAGSRAHAYRYYEAADGRTGLVGLLEHRTSTGSLSSAGETAQARIQLLAPDDELGWWHFWADELGSCYRDRSTELPWTPVDPGSPTLVLEGADGTPLSLVWDAAELGYNGVSGDGTAPPETLQPGTTWSLPDFEGTEQPALSFADLAHLPAPLTVTWPEMEDAGLSLSQEELSFRWVSAEALDAVLLTLILVDGGTGEVQERVTCAVDDTGSFDLPEGAFNTWAEGLVLYLRIGAAVEGSATLPMDGSLARVLGVTTLASAATTR